MLDPLQFTWESPVSHPLESLLQPLGISVKQNAPLNLLWCDLIRLPGSARGAPVHRIITAESIPVVVFVILSRGCRQWRSRLFLNNMTEWKSYNFEVEPKLKTFCRWTQDTRSPLSFTRCRSYLLFSWDQTIVCYFSHLLYIFDRPLRSCYFLSRHMLFWAGMVHVFTSVLLRTGSPSKIARGPLLGI